MPSNLRLITGWIRPPLCQRWQHPAINEFRSFLNYFVIQKNTTLSILQLELQKWYLCDQYDPAINVFKYEIDRFKTMVWRIERLYPLTHSFRDMTILKKKLCHHEEGPPFGEGPPFVFLVLSSAVRADISFLFRLRHTVFEIWQFKVFVMYCQWGFCDPEPHRTETQNSMRNNCAKNTRRIYKNRLKISKKILHVQPIIL